MKYFYLVICVKKKKSKYIHNIVKQMKNTETVQGYCMHLFSDPKSIAKHPMSYEDKLEHRIFEIGLYQPIRQCKIQVKAL